MQQYLVKMSYIGLKTPPPDAWAVFDDAGAQISGSSWQDKPVLVSNTIPNTDNAPSELTAYLPQPSLAPGSYKVRWRGASKWFGMVAQMYEGRFDV